MRDYMEYSIQLQTTRTRKPCKMHQIVMMFDSHTDSYTSAHAYPSSRWVVLVCVLWGEHEHFSARFSRDPFKELSRSRDNIPISCTYNRQKTQIQLVSGIKKTGILSLAVVS